MFPLIFLEVAHHPPHEVADPWGLSGYCDEVARITVVTDHDCKLPALSPHANCFVEEKKRKVLWRKSLAKKDRLFSAVL